MRCYMRCHYGYIRDEALDWYRHGIDYRKKTCSQRSTTLLFVKSVLTSVFRNKRKSIVQSLMAWQNAGFIPPALAVLRGSEWWRKERQRQRKRFLLTILGRVDQVDVDRLWPLLLGAGQVLVVQRRAAPLHRRVLVAGIVKTLVFEIL